jgi:hypothetical protein
MRVFSRDCFKKSCHLGMAAGAMAFALTFAGAVLAQQPPERACMEYSDPFEAFNPERWQEVLLYSKARGKISVDNGWLSISTPVDEPCEIQVYSLFSLDGDFDIQADYDLAGSKELPLCRFNAGLVVQTLGDEKSYKCYIAAAQKEDLLFRARLDVSGEKNLEKYKGRQAPRAGTIRIIRKEGQLSFLALDAGEWRTLHTFAGPCQEKLRVRFKLQTSEDEEGVQACPVTVKFDNFKVNSCDKIVDE